jgi:hypothetical protein
MLGTAKDDRANERPAPGEMPPRNQQKAWFPNATVVLHTIKALMMATIGTSA